MTTRYALVASDRTEIEAYLPENYKVLTRERPGDADERYPNGVTLISGKDVAGWTLDDYVIPRLASGLYFARECDSREAGEAALRAAEVLAGRFGEVRA